uniref:Sugar phosphate transporter domain-containing protein n=1 Tax=Monopterus albus TaxID=43700 RepID=A0A3Q3IYM0_MONAL
MACPVQFLCRGLRTVALIILYYVFSIGITFYNKWMMKGFHYPLFMTLVHLAINFCLSALTRKAMQRWTGKARVILSWTDYFNKVAPTALATALDIGLSNWSFLFITVSLYTMTKSTAVLFILFFSLVFKLEEPNPFLILVVLLIAGGLFMFTFESTQFNLKGFIMVLLASFLGGIRWTLTQVLMQKAELGLQNPVDTMYHLQPLMFLDLFPLFLYNEGEINSYVIILSSSLCCHSSLVTTLNSVALIMTVQFIYLKCVVDLSPGNQQHDSGPQGLELATPGVEDGTEDTSLWGASVHNNAG